MTKQADIHRLFKDTTGVSLWPYQMEDAARLTEGHFGLFQDTGLGKTFTALAALLYLDRETPEEEHQDSVAIWIGPRLSLDMVKANILKAWPGADERVQIIRKSSDHVHPDAAFHLVSPDLIRNAKIREALIRVGTPTVVVDEAHRFKTPNSARTKALLGEDLDGEGGVVDGATRVWLLSGTPMPNGLPGELFPAFKALWPHYMPRNAQGSALSFWQYRNRYHHIETKRINGRMVHIDRGARNIDEWRDRFGKLFVRRRIEDYLDLDEPIIEETVLQSDDLKSLWGPDEDSPIWDHNFSADTVLEHVNQEQIATAMRLTGSLKVQPTVELVEQLLEDGAGQVLVGFWHRDVGSEIAERLAQALKSDIDLITGESSAKYARQAIDAFQRTATTVLVGQIAAMGEAHNLQNCHHVVLAEQAWVPGMNKQFIARCHRQGQKSRVIVRSVILEGSPDENVSRALTRKIKDQAKALGEEHDPETKAVATPSL